jgi:site-specific recombinase XerD
MAGLNIKYNLINVKKHKYLYISVSWQKERVRIPLDFVANENNWDKKAQKFKPSAMHAGVMNSKLNNITIQLIDFYNNRISVNKQPIERNEIIHAVKSIIRPTEKIKQKSFLEYYEQFMNDSLNGDRLTEQGKPIQPSTVKAYQSTFTHLKVFEIKNKFKLDFNNDNDFFNKFIQYCAGVNLTNNTIGRHVKTLKSFLIWAKKKNFHNNSNLIQSLKVYNVETTKVSLTFEEIAEIEALTDLTVRLNKIKDLFLLELYTGLRVSDLFGIKPENIDFNSKIITYVTIKTHDQLVIPIEDKAINILKKYDCRIPSYTGQKYNQGIKDLCKIAGIDKPIQVVKYIGGDRIDEVKPKYELISSHTARRSFITNLLKKGLLAEQIMLITGHKDRSSFERYITVSLDDSIKHVREAMK